MASNKNPVKSRTRFTYNILLAFFTHQIRVFPHNKLISGAKAWRDLTVRISLTFSCLRKTRSSGLKTRPDYGNHARLRRFFFYYYYYCETPCYLPLDINNRKKKKLSWRNYIKIHRTYNYYYHYSERPPPAVFNQRYLHSTDRRRRF